jgi:SEC-C motif-containing protein
MSAEQLCPCGSGRVYGDCCGPFHRGAALPATPEQLMRSRYSAYVLFDEEYLRQSWHPSTRPSALGLSSGVEWLGLKIVDAPMPQGSEGWVEFSARFSQDGRVGLMQERSRFLHEAGRWFYVDGQLHASAKPAKIGRNDPCPCGSGRKYKQCCGK